MPGEYDYHDTDGQVRWPHEPTTTDSGIELDAHIDKFYKNYKKGGLIAPEFVLAIIERLRTADTNLEIRSEQLANVQNRITLERKEHEEQVEREIRGRNNVIAELEAELAKYREVWLDDYVKGLETELDQAKESLRTTRLEQAAKAFQVDELETKVRDLTADKQAWMAENTELLTQVERLTEERNSARAEGETSEQAAQEFYKENRMLKFSVMRYATEVEREIVQLREQVESLTAQLAATGSRPE